MLCCRQIDIALHLVPFYSRQRGNRPFVLDLSFKCRALSREASSTIFKVFGMTRPGFEPTTSHTPGERSTTRSPGAVTTHYAFGYKMWACLKRHSINEVRVVLLKMLSGWAVNISKGKRGWVEEIKYWGEGVGGEICWKRTLNVRGWMGSSESKCRGMGEVYKTSSTPIPTQCLLEWPWDIVTRMP